MWYFSTSFNEIRPVFYASKIWTASPKPTNATPMCKEIWRRAAAAAVKPTRRSHTALRESSSSRLIGGGKHSSGGTYPPTVRSRRSRHTQQAQCSALGPLTCRCRSLKDGLCALDLPRPLGNTKQREGGVPEGFQKTRQRSGFRAFGILARPVAANPAVERMSEKRKVATEGPPDETSGWFALQRRRRTLVGGVYCG